MSFSDSINNLATALYLSQRGVPKCPDGTYEPKEAPKGLFLDGLDLVMGRIKRDDGIELAPGSLKAANDAVESLLTGSGSNDRLHGFEFVLDKLAKSDPASKFVSTVNDLAITGLYESLQHPPQSYVGPSKFRKADGSGNNIYLPNIGKAGELYARSVRSATPAPVHDLPDPGLIFDTLLRREYKASEGKNNHPGGQSALTFAFASLVTHSLFRTSPGNNNCNDTSSYLDLSPLYGCNQMEQDSVRVKTGYGKLAPDCFAEERLGHLPPACAALLVIFNRNHNYIADMLLKINEQKSWKDPRSYVSPDTNPELARQDEEIFQTARLVNCGHFMTMIFYDYVSGFLGETRHMQSWHLKPFDIIKRPDGTTVGRGQGNHVSVEFNLLYRWHATISDKDEQWTEEVVEEVFGTRDWDSIDVKTFGAGLAQAGRLAEPDPKKRTFGGLVRGTDGRFDDNALATLLQDATDSPAQRYGARGTPAVLRPVEMAAINQGRKWGVCTMNEFRTFLGLRPFASFEEWNSDPKIAEAARKLYIHIDRLELYAGIQAEQNLDLTYGSGFCCGYTLMRAILTDAICLVRGDRFYTTDFTPSNLTNWGFIDCQPTDNNGAGGANLPKLLLRHLPNQYSYNSVYGLFPFHTPVAMKKNLTDLKLVEKYNFDRANVQDVVQIHTLQAIRTVFNDNKRFHVTYTDNMNYLTQGYGFFLVFEDDKRHSVDKALCMHALWPTTDSLKEFAEFYKKTTAQLIQEESYHYPVVAGSRTSGKYVDIVRRVINITSVRWACEYLTGIIPKSEEHPHAMFTEEELYNIFTVLFMAVFENIYPEHGWVLRTVAKQVGDVINGFIEKSLKQVMPGFASIFAREVSYVLDQSISGRPCHDFLQRLAASGRPLKDLTACVIGLTVGSSVNYAQQCSQIVDFYLDDARTKERNDIVQLVSKYDAESTNRLVGYVKEAQRLAPQVPGLLRQCVASEPVVIEQGNGLPNVVVNPGQQVWAGYYDAQTNAHDFPDPFTVNPERPRANYAVQGIGFHGCPGVDYAEKTLVEVIRVIFGLKNVRRAPGTMGTLASFEDSQFGTKSTTFVDPTGNVTPWPGSLIIAYD